MGSMRRKRRGLQKRGHRHGREGVHRQRRSRRFSRDLEHIGFVRVVTDRIMRFDSTGRLLYTSGFGNSSSEEGEASFLGRTHRELGFPEETCAQIDAMLEQVFNTGKPYRTILAYETPEGAALLGWYVIPETDGEGVVVHALAIAREITSGGKFGEKPWFQPQVLDCIDDSIVITTLDGIVVYWGGGAERLYGYHSNEVLGRPYGDFAGSLEDFDHEQMAQTILKAGHWAGETLQKRKDGSRFWAAVRISVLRDADDRPIGFIGIDRDISDRKRSEKELLASRQLFSSVVRIQKELICRFTPDTKLTFVNDAYCKYFGMEESELIGRKILSFIPEEYHETIRTKLASMSVDNPYLDYTHQVIRPDGSIGWQEWTDHALFDEIGGVVEFQSVGRDITEQKMAVEALKKNEERFHAMIRSMQDLVFILDEGMVLREYFQPEGERLYKKTEEFLNKHLSEIGLPEIVYTELHDVVATTLRTGRLGKTAYCLDMPGRGRAWYDLNATVLRNQHGESTGVMCVIRDISELKEVEQELKEKQAELDRYFTLSLDMMCIANTEGYFVRLNPEWERSLGYPMKELEGMRFLDLVHPDDLEQTYQQIANLRNQEQVTGFENRYRCRDGSYRWVEWRSIPEGNLIYAAARDITERKKVEETLSLSREQFQLAVEGSNDGIWDWNLRDGTLYLSPRWKEQLGYTDDELENSFQTFKKLVFPVDYQRVMNHVDEYLRGEEPAYSIEFRMRHKDGSHRWILARGKLVHGTDGVPVRMSGSHTDITERKRFEEQILKHSQLQQLLMSISTLYISLPLAQVDSAIEKSLGEIGSFMGAIRAYIYDYDFTRRVAINTHEWCKAGIEPFMDKFPEIPTSLASWMVDAHKLGRYVEIGNTAELPKGEFRGLLEMQGAKSISTAPLMDGGSCLGFLGFDFETPGHEQTGGDKGLLELFARMIINVRKRREIEEELQQRRVQADAANRAKSDFLANMSHEIRTPMNGVFGMTSLLLDTDLTTEQRRFAETVKTSAEALLSLLNDILDLSKIEAGKFELSHIDFNLYQLIDDMIGPHAMRAQEKGVEFVVHVAPDVTRNLHGDPARLRQILVNLIGNAVKFTARGEVSLQIKQLVTMGDVVQLRFDVIDTGIGIPEDKKERLFKQFSQVDNSTSRNYGGSGLGLAIARQLVEMMEGEIGFVSREAGGSVFWFTAKLEKAHDRIEPKTQEPLEIIGSHVLVVDDNRMQREYLTARLLEEGCRVEAVSNGLSALNQIRRARDLGTPFDAVIVDLEMPGMDGLSLAERISGLYKSNGPKVVLLTSVNSGVGRSVAAKKGVSSTIPKPVRLIDLKRSIAGQVQHQTVGQPTQQDQPTKAPIPASRVLLVEDNPINRMVALNLLGKLGLSIDCAEDGTTALEMLEKRDYQLLFMDIQMPGMDGFETTARIREAENAGGGERRTIIAMTAHAMQGDREQCLEAGMDDYIAKPITRQALEEVLARWLPTGGRQP